jgi:hypothetical protein
LSTRDPSPEDERPGNVDVGGALRRSIPLVAVGAVVFAAGVGVAELAGELGSDVDLKPFFLVYLLVAMARFGGPTLALGLGAAVGEGVHDLIEGYEPDEPLGFVGFVVGFMLFGWLLHRFAPDPGDRRYQALAAVAAAFVQALFEGFAFLFGAEFGPTEAIISVVGNTVTHGVVLGAVPFVLLYPLVRGGWWVFPGPASD